MPPTNQNRAETHQKKGEQPIADAIAECVFPEDIMLCILTRLPVKSLLRFKSVCKPWRELFGTPNFIKMHHHQFSSHPKNDAFIIQSLSQSYDLSLSLLSIESNTKKPANPPCPVTVRYPMTFSVSSCNGLVCINFRPLDMGLIGLWNPALRLSKFVRVETDFADPEQISLGLGYDAEGDDFNVVRIFYAGPTSKHGVKRIGVDVYSAKSYSLEKIKVDFQFRVLWVEPTAIVNGNPYWVAEYFDGDESLKCRFGEVILVWCDVTKLEWKAVSLSDLRLERVSSAIPYTDWKGSLAALGCGMNKYGLESIDVWVYDDGEMTWRNNYTFGPIEIGVDRCLHCSKNGMIMGKCRNGKLFVFDPESEWVKEIENEGQQCFHQVFGYNESLAYIKGMEQVDGTSRRQSVKREEEEDEDDPIALLQHRWEILGSYPFLV